MTVYKNLINGGVQISSGGGGGQKKNEKLISAPPSIKDLRVRDNNYCVSSKPSYILKITNKEATFYFVIMASLLRHTNQCFSLKTILRLTIQVVILERLELFKCIFISWVLFATPIDYLI